MSSDSMNEPQFLRAGVKGIEVIRMSGIVYWIRHRGHPSTQNEYLLLDRRVPPDHKGGFRMFNISVVDTGILFENDLPHLRSRHGYFPGVVKISDGILMAAYVAGEAFESVDRQLRQL